jgi:hypothetical protein
MIDQTKSQALQTMAKAFEACGFKGDTIKGTMSEGGSIWLAAQALYSDSVWNPLLSQVTFADGSAIEYVRDPGSMFSTTYKAIPAPVTAQVAPETRNDLTLAKYLLDEVKDYATAQDGALLVNFHDKGVWRMLPGTDSGNWEERETLVHVPTGARFIPYATIAQAYEWLTTPEQTAYCRNVLSISPNDSKASFLVDKLERRFTELLKMGDN